MKKRLLIISLVIVMALSFSMAFAEDNWQDGVAKALDENNFTGAMILAFNSQASPQAVYEALEAFGVEEEGVNQSFMMAANPCAMVCAFHQISCCNASPSEPRPEPECTDAEIPPCKCTCP